MHKIHWSINLVGQNQPRVLHRIANMFEIKWIGRTVYEQWIQTSFQMFFGYWCTWTRLIAKIMLMYICVHFLLLDLLLVSCRCNTSLLIDYCQDEGAHKYIIIDVGKTFREQVLRWFVRHKIPCVDSVSPWYTHACFIFFSNGLLDNQMAN